MCAPNIHTSHKLTVNWDQMAKRKVLGSNFIKFHLFIDNNQWAAEQGGCLVVALNCEVFIEWTLANINSSQWGQIIRAASYKSVKQEYCLLSRHHRTRTPGSWNLMSWLLILLICCDIFVKSIRIILTREITHDLRQGDSWELYRRDSVKNLFRPCRAALIIIARQHRI